ncbi:MAG: hypothetical protein MZV64_63170 [Ignavibacteriales bacterium]|nr:hypothetical protein [Ignavibacteriales bacterium]
MRVRARGLPVAAPRRADLRGPRTRAEARGVAPRRGVRHRRGAPASCTPTTRGPSTWAPTASSPWARRRRASSGRDRALAARPRRPDAPLQHRLHPRRWPGTSTRPLDCLERAVARAACATDGLARARRRPRSAPRPPALQGPAREDVSGPRMAILVPGLRADEKVRRPRRRGRHRLRDPRGRVLRLPRPERGRQDHDRADDPLRLARDLGDAHGRRHGRRRSTTGPSRAMTGVIPQEITLDNDLTVAREPAWSSPVSSTSAAPRPASAIAELLQFVELEAKARQQDRPSSRRA